MADRVLGSASVEVFADLSKLRSGLQTARRTTDGAARDMAASAATARRSFERAGDSLTRSVRGARAETERLNRELRGTDVALLSIFSGIGAGAAITGVVRLADEFANLRARIRNVTQEGEDADAIFGRLFSSAQRNSASVASLTELYVRLRQAIAGLGDAEALRIGETLSQSLALSGASAQEAVAFLRQISQALASGVLRGDEFNSVMENNARFARLLADQIGVGVGQLRGLAEAGALTSDVLRAALAGGGAGIAAEFADLPLTVARATQQLENALLRYVSQTDQGLGASQRLAEGIQLLAENFNDLADAIVIVGAAGVANLAGRGAAAGLGAAAAVATGIAAQVGATKNRILDERDRAVERLQRSDDELARIASQRKMLAGKIEAANAKLAMAQETLERRLNEQAAPLPGDTRNRMPAKDYRQWTRSQQRMVEEYRQEVEKLRRTIGNLEAADNREAAAASMAQQRRRASASSIEDMNTRLRVHTGVMATAGRITSTVTRGMAAAFSSLVNVLGGPLPAAITVAALALIFYRSQADQTRAANNSLVSALGILRDTITPAEAEARRLAEQTQAVGDNSADAAEKAEALAKAQKLAAEGAALRAKEERALAEAQKIQALATIQQAIADQRQVISGARRRLLLTAGPLGMTLPGSMPAIDRQYEIIAKAEESIRTLEDGLKALASGERVLGSSVASTSDAMSGANALADARARALGRAGDGAKSAAEAERILQGLIDDANRNNAAGIRELDEKDARRAEERAQRARQIIDDNLDALTKAREAFSELDSLAGEGLFAGQDKAAAAAFAVALEEIAYAAGDAAEALALLRSVSGLDPEAAEKVAGRIGEAAQAGRRDRAEQDDARRLFRRADIAEEVKRGLYEGVTTGQWKNAFRDAIANSLSRALERGLDRLVDAIFYGASGGKSGGIFDTILSAVVGGVTGSAVGGLFSRQVSLSSLAPESLATSGSVEAVRLSAGASLSAAGGAGSSVGRLSQTISIDMRGANIEDPALAAARIRAAAQQGALMGAQMVQDRTKALTTL